MAPKKAAAKKAGAGDEPADETVNNFWKFYKRNCQNLGAELNKKIKEEYEVGYLEEA